MQRNEQETLYRNLGFKIRIAREKMDINQSLFANMLELSRSSVVNIEMGRQRPTIHLLYEISRITKTSLSDLLTELIPEKATNQVLEIKEKISYSLSNLESVNKIADLIIRELD